MLLPLAVAVLEPTVKLPACSTQLVFNWLPKMGPEKSSLKDRLGTGEGVMSVAWKPLMLGPTLEAMPTLPVAKVASSADIFRAPLMMSLSEEPSTWKLTANGELPGLVKTELVASWL